MSAKKRTPTKKSAKKKGPPAKRAANKTPAKKSATKKRRLEAPLQPASSDFYELRLYVAGQSPKSIVALANLNSICEEHLHGRYRIEIVDLMKQPQLARGDQILAVPTLVRKLPEPIRKLVGDLSNTESALVGLDLRPARSTTR